MNKKVIIDGVNVTECSYYDKDNEPYCCEIWDNECEAQNCYWKQLQQAKAENEQLKEKISILKGNIDIYQMSENEANETIAEVKARNNEIKNFKFRKALEEIKEIAAKAFNLEDDDGGYLYQKILTKINEVLK